MAGWNARKYKRERSTTYKAKRDSFWALVITELYVVNFPDESNGNSYRRVNREDHKSRIHFASHS